MKKLLLLSILITQACAAVPVVAGSVVAIHRGSKIGDDLRSTYEARNDANTMTETAFQRCESGDEAACMEQAIYTVTFFVPDNIFAPLFGCQQHLGASHGRIWNCIDKKLPQISKVQENHGGARYNQMLTNR